MKLSMRIVCDATQLEILNNGTLQSAVIPYNFSEPVRMICLKIGRNASHLEITVLAKIKVMAKVKLEYLQLIFNFFNDFRYTNDKTFSKVSLYIRIS